MSAGITLTGRLVADPELKFTAKGDAVCNLRVVTSGRRKTDAGWQDVDTTFWTVAAWRQLGENVAESLTKGVQVVVVGKVKSREWQDNDGNKRVAWEVDAQHVAADLLSQRVTVQRVLRSNASAPAVDDPWSKPFIPVDENAPF